jgi:hypothetical protein
LYYKLENLIKEIENKSKQAILNKELVLSDNFDKVENLLKSCENPKKEVR